MTSNQAPLYIPIQRLYGAMPTHDSSTHAPLLPFHATPLPRHFPSYTQLHPLSAPESMFSQCMESVTRKALDILELQRDDLLIVKESKQSTIGDPFDAFGIWPRSRFASYRHIEIDHGWLCMELDSVAGHELEFHVVFSRLNGPEESKLRQYQRSHDGYQLAPPIDYQAMAHTKHFDKSVFMWMYFPLPGTWKVTVYIRKRDTENYTPCFEYEVIVRRTWEYHVGGFCPSIFQNTFLHFDDRMQIIQPLQNYLEQGSQVTFKVLLNTQLFSHVGILMSRQQFPKKIFFLDVQQQHAKMSTNATHFPMQLFSGDISVDFFQGAELSNDAPQVHILLFEHSDTLLRSPHIVATYSVQVDIQRFPLTFGLQGDTTATASDIIASGPKDSLETLFSIDAGNAANGKASTLTSGQRLSSPISKAILDKKSKYSKLARFWTHDMHLFQPKSRFLRAGERSRFKVRIVGAHKVVVRVGKRSYTIEKVPSLFQSVTGSENRMELFESVIVFKEPEDSKVSLVNFFYYTSEKDKNGMHGKVPIAQFVLQSNPVTKKLEKTIAALAEDESESEEDATTTMAPPAPEHRPLVAVAKESSDLSRQRKGNSVLPNLRPSSSFTKSQVVYSVDVSKSLPTSLAQKVLKQLPFLKVPKQVDSAEYFKELEKPKRPVQLNEYWQELNERQKSDRIEEDVMISGHKTTDQLGNNIVSAMHTRNELASVLLKNPQVEDLIAKQSRFTRYLESTFDTPTLAFSSETRRFHKVTRSNDKSLDGMPHNALLHTGQIITLDNLGLQHFMTAKSQGTSREVGKLKQAEQAMYASTGTSGIFTLDANHRTESRAAHMKRQKKMNEHRRMMHLISQQEQRKVHEQHTSIDDIVDRVRTLMEEQDIHKLVKEADVELDFFAGHTRESKRHKNPSRKPYIEMQEKHAKANARRVEKPPIKQEVVFVQPVSISPRKAGGTQVNVGTHSGEREHLESSAPTQPNDKAPPKLGGTSVRHATPDEAISDDDDDDFGFDTITAESPTPEEKVVPPVSTFSWRQSKQQALIQKPKKKQKARKIRVLIYADEDDSAKLTSPVAPLLPSLEENVPLSVISEQQTAATDDESTDDVQSNSQSARIDIEIPTQATAGPLVEYSKHKELNRTTSRVSSGATTRRKSPPKRTPNHSKSISPEKKGKDTPGRSSSISPDKKNASTKDALKDPAIPESPLSVFVPEPEDPAAKGEKVKELKRKLKEEKIKAQEMRDKAMAKKAERAARLKAQQKAEERKKKEQTKQLQFKKQQEIARKKEEAIQKQTERAELLKLQRQQERIQSKLDQEKYTEKRKKEQAERERASKKLLKKSKKKTPQNVVMDYCRYIAVMYHNMKGKCSWMPSVCPLSATDVRVALNLSGTQSLFLSIVGLRHPETGEVFEFHTKDNSIFPELPVETELDVNVVYEVIIEDKRHSDVSSLSQEEVDEIRALFDLIDKNGNGEIDEEELRHWYEEIESQKLSEQNEYFDSLVIAHPEMASEIENRRRAAALQSKQRVNYNIRAYQESDIDGDKLISFDEFLAHEARKRRVVGGA